MNRRATVGLAILVTAAVAAAPATAGPKKAPIKGSYDVTLLPDPSPNATSGPCENISPLAIDKHPFSVPAAGTLTVILDSPDPTGAGVTDWDMSIVDAEGAELTGGSGATSHEEASMKFKKGEPVSIYVCNLAGQPQGTVSYTFTYK